MKRHKILIIISLAIFSNCSVLFDYVFSGPKYLSDKKLLRRVCEEIKNDTVGFLKEKLITIDDTKIDTFDLGNNYKLESGYFKYSKSINFWVSKITNKNEIISARYYPEPEIGKTFENQYVEEFRKCGFKFNNTESKFWTNKIMPQFYREEYQFQNKLCDTTEIRKIVIDYCSPFRRTIFEVESEFGHSDIFKIDSLKNQLSIDEINFLSASLNPIARGISAYIIKSRKIKDADAIYESIIKSGGDIYFVVADFKSKEGIERFVKTLENVSRRINNK